MSRRVVAAIAMAALVLPLVGCVELFLPPNPRPTSTPTGEDVAPDLERFYGQQLVWERCGDGMQCTTAEAPLDWSAPSAGSIDLALVRHPASGTPQGSLLVNPGGPGGSGFSMVMTQLDFAVGDRVQQAFDVVGYDPRGVGRSTAVSCYADPDEFDAYLFDLPEGEPGSEEWIASEEEATTALGAGCAANTGPVLAHVDSVSSARDLDLLRAVLGDERLNLLGYSYGSKLGAIYATLYPERTGRMVLDGALDPNADSFTVALGQAEGFEGLLREFVADCLDRDDCPVDGSVDSAMRDIGDLFDEVDERPILVDDGRALDSGALFTAVIYPLYSPSSWGTLRTMLAQVRDGTAGQAFRIIDAYYGRGADGEYDENSTEAFLAVNCLDYTLDDDPAVMAEQAAELSAVAPVLGPQLAYGGVGCAGWPVEAADRLEVTGAGSGDILVLGATQDPATPYAWSVALAALLPKGHLVSAERLGHTSYNKGIACVDEAVEDYLVDGLVPAGDVDCR